MEINSLSELESLVTDDSWLILDVDQTLLRSPTMWGSEAWFYYRIGLHRAAGMAKEAAILLANEEWEATQTHLMSVAMEATTAKQVRVWQERGITTLGLTARRPEIAELTRRHLAALGIDLAATAPRLQTPGFLAGIQYVGPLASKGAEFAKALSALKVKPTRIVFTDDRAEHIATMQRHCERLDIAFEGRRYAGGDRYMKDFNVAQAEKEAR